MSTMWACSAFQSWCKEEKGFDSLGSAEFENNENKLLFAIAL